MKVLKEAPPVRFPVQLGIVLHPELNGPPEDLKRNNIPVSLGYNLPINTSGRRSSRGPVIFRRLGYHLYLIGSEPFREPGILTDNLPGGQMMGLPPFHKACVMESGSRIDHVLIDIIESGESQSLTDNAPGVIFPMCLVKSGITGNYLTLYIILKILVHGSIRKFRKVTVDCGKKLFQVVLIVSGEGHAGLR